MLHFFILTTNFSSQLNLEKHNEINQQELYEELNLKRVILIQSPIPVQLLETEVLMEPGGTLQISHFLMKIQKVYCSFQQPEEPFL